MPSTGMDTAPFMEAVSSTVPSPPSDNTMSVAEGESGVWSVMPYAPVSSP